MRIIDSRVLNIMMRESEKQFTIKELNRLLSPLGFNEQDMDNFEKKGFIRKVLSTSSTTSEGTYEARYQITPKGIQHQRAANLAGKRDYVLLAITWHRNNEFTINDINEYLKYRTVISYDSIYEILDILCNEGYIVKKQSSSEVRQENIIYIKTQKAIKRKKGLLREVEARDRKRKIKKILTNIKSNPILGALVLGLIFILGGLLLTAIIWGLISIFS